MFLLSLRLLVRGASRFPGFPPIPFVFMPNSLLFTQKSCSTLVSTRIIVHGAHWRGGSLWWLVGVLGLVPVFSRVYSLTCQHDSGFRIPARLSFQQGTGDPSSADHLWIGPHNGDCDSTVYPPLYLQKWFFPFSMSWLDSIERSWQGLPPLAFRPLR